MAKFFYNICDQEVVEPAFMEVIHKKHNIDEWVESLPKVSGLKYPLNIWYTIVPPDIRYAILLYDENEISMGTYVYSIAFVSGHKEILFKSYTDAEGIRRPALSLYPTRDIYVSQSGRYIAIPNWSTTDDNGMMFLDTVEHAYAFHRMNKSKKPFEYTVNHHDDHSYEIRIPHTLMAADIAQGSFLYEKLDWIKIPENGIYTPSAINEEGKQEQAG